MRIQLSTVRLLNNLNEKASLKINISVFVSYSIGFLLTSYPVVQILLKFGKEYIHKRAYSIVLRFLLMVIN